MDAINAQQLFKTYEHVRSSLVEAHKSMERLDEDRIDAYSFFGSLVSK